MKTYYSLEDAERDLSSLTAHAENIVNDENLMAGRSYDRREFTEGVVAQIKALHTQVRILGNEIENVRTGGFIEQERNRFNAIFEDQKKAIDDATKALGAMVFRIAELTESISALEDRIRKAELVVKSEGW